MLSKPQTYLKLHRLPGLKTDFVVARFENGDFQCKVHCPDVRSHALRVNRGTCVIQNSSLAMLITAIDALFKTLLSLEGWLLIRTL